MRIEVIDYNEAIEAERQKKLAEGGQGKEEEAETGSRMG